MSSEFDDLIEDKALGAFVAVGDEVHHLTAEQLAAFKPDTGSLDSDPPLPPLTDEEHQAMEESMAPASEVLADLGVPEEPDLSGTELRLLKDDEVPVVGTHYVVWGDPAKPMPVIVSYARTLKEHLYLLTEGGGAREVRAVLYASWRYKGFLCGQVSGL